MTKRFTASRLLLAAFVGAGLLSAPLVGAPAAHAACVSNQFADPITGVCWDSSQFGSGISGTGGTCLPGRLGLCLGALANSQMPGANLKPQPAAGPAPRSTWP